MDRDLAPLVDSSVFAHVQARAEMRDLIGDASISVDLAVPRITFAVDGDERSYAAEVIGSVDPSAESWMWGWYNVNGLPDRAIERARLVEHFGQEHDIERLDTPVLSFAQASPRDLLLAAQAITGPTHWVEVRTGTGIIVYLAVDIGPLELPDPARIMRVIMEGLGTFTVERPRSAIPAYAERVGLECRSGESTAVLSGRGGGVVIRFDARGRVAALQLADDDLELLGAGQHAGSPDTAAMGVLSIDRVETRAQGEPIGPVAEAVAAVPFRVVEAAEDARRPLARQPRRYADPPAPPASGDQSARAVPPVDPDASGGSSGRVGTASSDVDAVRRLHEPDLFPPEEFHTHRTMRSARGAAIDPRLGAAAWRAPRR